MSEIVALADLSRFTIKIAEQVISVEALSSAPYAYCISFLSNEKPAIQVSICKEDVRRVTEESNLAEPYINEKYNETIAVYQKIVDKVLDYDLFLMHGAVVAIGNEAFMFSAPSGTGKTTHIKQWLKKVKDVFVVNGDKPLIKIAGTQAIACGTPWCGKERMGTNTMVPLKAIVFMERSEENHMEEIAFSQAYPYLLQQSHIPSDPEKAKKTLDLISKLYGKVSFWRFQCNNFKDDCFDVAYNALIGEKA